MTGNFNLFFNSELEAQGGNPILKIKNLQLHSLNLKRLMIYVIYRGVRILKSKRLTFTQKHSSGFIQLRLDSSRICKHDRDTDSCFNRSFSGTLLSLKRKNYN